MSVASTVTFSVLFCSISSCLALMSGGTWTRASAGAVAWAGLILPDVLPMLIAGRDGLLTFSSVIVV